MCTQQETRDIWPSPIRDADVDHWVKSGAAPPGSTSPFANRDWSVDGRVGATPMSGSLSFVLIAGSRVCHCFIRGCQVPIYSFCPTSYLDQLASFCKANTSFVYWGFGLL